MSSVTIGDQTFIRADGQWIDKKTKVKAPDDLLKLLNMMAPEAAEEQKKQRIRIDKNRPEVKFGNDIYVYNLNANQWIDKKTKIPINPRFAAAIEALATPREDKPIEAAKQAVANSIVNNIGTVGQTKVKKPTGAGKIPTAKKSGPPGINAPLVLMIEKLATIDGYLKQRLDNQKTIHERNVAALREASIEAPASDATPVTENENQPEKKSNALAIATAVGLAGLIAYQFDPVKETIKSVIEYSKGVYNFIGGVIDTINNGLKFFLGNNTAVPAGTVTVNSSGNLQAADGYKIATGTTTGNQYVYREGSNVGYGVERNPVTGQASINYNQTARIIPSSSTGNSIVPSSSTGNSSSAPSSPSRSNTSGGSSVGRSSSTSTQAQARPTTATQNAAPVTSSPPAPQATPESSANARDVLQFTSGSGDEAHFNNLQPETRSAVLAAAAEYKQTTGQRLTISSGGRSDAEQARLYNMSVQQGTPGRIRWPSGRVTPVARPGHSNHGRGWAVDIGQAGDPTARSILEKHGMMWYGASDAVHYTLRGHGEGGGGSSGGGDSILDSVAHAASETFSAGMRGISKIAKVLTGGDSRTFIPMSEQTSAAAGIQSATINRNAAVASSNSPPAPKPAPRAPNLNAAKGAKAPVQNPPTQNDRDGSVHYLQRQGLAQ